MHGLINSAIQSFVCATYGRACWLRATEAAGLGFAEFEAMLVATIYGTNDRREGIAAFLEKRPANFTGT